MMPLIIILPWPSRNLHPNARAHWGTRQRCARKARTDAGWAAMEAGLKRMKADALSVTAVFYPPDRRQRDVDGMLSNIKSYLDGIADVVGVDDSKWSIAIRREEPRKPGAVHIEIQAVAA
jgi:crossover junction endodeoxyribonuclease RusA